MHAYTIIAIPVATKDATPKSICLSDSQVKTRLPWRRGGVGMLVRRSGSAPELKVMATRMSERASDRPTERPRRPRLPFRAPSYLFSAS